MIAELAIEPLHRASDGGVRAVANVQALVAKEPKILFRGLVRRGAETMG